MTTFHKSISRIAIVATTTLLLAACTEEAVDSKGIKTAISTVTEDKVAQLQREAQKGDPDAQYNLAYLYENGLGVPKDETKALGLYQKAADQGHSDAQSNLNAMSLSK